MKKQVKNYIREKLIPKYLLSIATKIYHWYLRNIVSFLYKGNKFECPFCGHKFRKLLSDGVDREVFRKKKIVGGGYRENILCPYCLSYERERLLYIFFKEKTDLFKKDIKLLHVAPEKNLQKIFKNSKNIEYLSADISSPLADIKLDITDIPYENEFDVIICNHVLEHIEDDIRVMKQIYKALRSNGWAILQVPISLNLEETYEDFSIKDPRDREIIFGQRDHVRVYAQDYKGKLKEAGFKVDICDPSDDLGIEKVERYSLNKDEKIYICYK